MLLRAGILPVSKSYSAHNANIRLQDNAGKSVSKYANKHPVIKNRLEQVLAKANTDFEEVLFNDSAKSYYATEKGISINSVDRNGTSLLMRAIKEKDAAVIEWCLNRVNIHLADTAGCTALGVAAQTRDMVLLKRLLKGGAALGGKDARDVPIPVTRFAGLGGDLNIISHLLEQSASRLKITTAEGYFSIVIKNALYGAVAGRHVPVIDYLLEKFPSLFSSNCYVNALECKSRSMLRLLLQKKNMLPVVPDISQEALITKAVKKICLV